MEKKPEEPGRGGESLKDILARFGKLTGQVPPEEKTTPKAAVAAPPAETTAEANDTSETQEDDPGRYEGHLAEFPVFILDKRQRGTRGRDPLVYADTIRGPSSEPIPRKWEAWPGRLGFGGPSTAELFYELVQLYVEQGAARDHIHFGTTYALHRRLHPGTAKPDRKDYDRIRRDLDILCGYRFVCENAFYDRERKAYVHMREWSLFTGWTGYTRTPAKGSYPYQEELPFGAVGVSPVLRTIAKNRGLFCIGFETKLFRRLKPLEQRLAVYLAKMFVSQSTHRRFVDELAQALPVQIDPARPDNLRTVLRRAANGLLEAEVPILRSFAIEKAVDGRWLIVFNRARRPRQDYGISPQAAEALLPGVLLLVDELVDFTKSPQSRPWFTNCVRALGVDVSHFCFAQLKEACSIHQVRDRGALLTKIFEDKAGQLGKTLH